MANSLTTEKKPWTSIGSWTAAAAATPAVAARAYQTVKALAGVKVFELDPYTNLVEIRFEGTTDADTLVFDLMACRGEGDFFVRVATLTCTVGTMQMASATKLFVDTIVISNETWIKALINANGAGANYASRIIVDSCGYKSFALVATTIANTAYAEYSGW